MGFPPHGLDINACLDLTSKGMIPGKKCTQSSQPCLEQQRERLAFLEIHLWMSLRPGCRLGSISSNDFLAVVWLSFWKPLFYWFVGFGGSPLQKHNGLCLPDLETRRTASVSNWYPPFLACLRFLFCFLFFKILHLTSSRLVVILLQVL